MTPDLNAAFVSAGAADWGGVPFSRAAELMSPQAAEKALALCPGAKTVLVAAFPYFAGDRPGNLSLYARGEDYHRVLGHRLNTVCNMLIEKYEKFAFLAGVDASPLPERELAWMAGLGLRGRNGLLILPPYGSYVFLGTILTDAPLALPDRPPAPGCIDCGKCAEACPTGVLSEQMFHVKHCLSDLTQRKGELTAREAALLRAHPAVWGCDICQRVCPYNAAPALTPLPEFTAGLIDSLTADMVEGLTNRQFQEKYGLRAFSWRGPAVLRRNLKLKE